MTDWTPEKIEAAKAKRAATMAKKKEQEEKRKARYEAKQAAASSTGQPESQQQAAVKSRWAFEKATEQEIVQQFSYIKIDEGLQILAKMREQCELAAKTLNQRITSDDASAKCTYCDAPRPKSGHWRLTRTKRDPDTGQIRNYFFCSEACVVLQNKKEQGVGGLPDRGMIRGETPVSQ